MCSGGVCSILLLSLVARCLETIDVCIWRMFVFMSVVVTVGMFAVYQALLKIVDCWSVEVMLYACVGDVMDDVFFLLLGAICARVWEV